MADDLAAGTQAGRLRATVDTLAGDTLAGRRVGSAGGRAAADWLSGQLRAIGAEVRIAEFTVSGVRALAGTPVLTWTDGTTSGQLTHRTEFTEHLASTYLPAPRRAPLARAGSGPVRDCWLLAEAATPDVLTSAVAGGATGILVPRGVDQDGWMPKMLAGPAAGELPVIAVRADIHLHMTAAADTGGAEVTASMPLRTVGVTGANVQGVLRRPEPGGASVLLTAHYDGVGDDPARRLPGAADNASGVAVVLEAARQLAAMPAGAGLAVAFLDGEEVGAAGSAQHAGQLPPGTSVINVDGAGQLAGAAAIEAGGPAGALLAALDRAGRAVGVPLRGAPVASDNRRYAAAGLPAVGIGMGMAGYHSPGDTAERVDGATLLAATSLVAASVQQLRPAPERARRHPTAPTAGAGSP